MEPDKEPEEGDEEEKREKWNRMERQSPMEKTSRAFLSYLSSVIVIIADEILLWNSLCRVVHPLSNTPMYKTYFFT